MSLCPEWGVQVSGEVCPGNQNGGYLSASYLLYRPLSDCREHHHISQQLWIQLASNMSTEQCMEELWRIPVWRKDPLISIRDICAFYVHPKGRQDLMSLPRASLNLRISPFKPVFVSISLLDCHPNLYIH